MRNTPRPFYREEREEREGYAKFLRVFFAIFATFAVESFLHFSMNQGSQP